MILYPYHSERRKPNDKVIVLLLAVGMVFSLAACGKNEVADIEINGEKVSVTDFLIKYLSEYTSTDAFAEREEEYAENYGSPDTSFTVTRVLEFEADRLGVSKMSIHYLLVKADWWHLTEDGSPNDSILIVVNYDTGEVFDQYMADESWLEDGESLDYWNYIMLNSPLVGSGYDGGVILNNKEKRTELSAAEIAEINEALYK